MAQSPLSQPKICKSKGSELALDGETMYELGVDPWEEQKITLDAKDRDDIKNVEGILIESYRKEHGSFPPWNKVGGATVGRKRVRPGNY